MSCCKDEKHHPGGGGGSCSCGCGKHSHFGPAFWTKKEKIDWLQQDLDELWEEVKTVEERIDALKKE